MSQRVPVLMYHRIGQVSNKWEERYCVSPDRFADHMNRLAGRGMQACLLTDFFAWLRQEKELPEGSFLLTFDDGFMGVYDYAVTTLQGLGWPATVFLVSGRIGDRDEWSRGENPAGAAHQLLAAEQIHTMRDMGFTFHSHTRMHPDLIMLPDKELMEELCGSRRDLEDLLGEEVRYLAYPYGRYDERVRNAVQAAGYAAAFSAQPGFNRRGIDPFRIRRLDIFGSDTPNMLIRKINFGSNEGSLRQTYRYYSGRVAHRLGF